MKIKGSIEFGEEEKQKFIKSLNKIKEQDETCIGVTCIDCIFSYSYAKDGKSCTKNSIWNGEELITKRAEEILKKLEG